MKQKMFKSISVGGGEGRGYICLPKFGKNISRANIMIFYSSRATFLTYSEEEYMRSV